MSSITVPWPFNTHVSCLCCHLMKEHLKIDLVLEVEFMKDKIWKGLHLIYLPEQYVSQVLDDELGSETDSGEQTC